MNKKQIQSLFESFNRLNVLIIGDVMLDTYVWGNVSRISPEAPVPIVAVTKKESRLGGAANVALNIKAMEATPILCSVIGDDENGKAFLNLLKQQDLTSKGIIISKERTTTCKTRIIGNKHQMLRVDEEVIDTTSVKITNQLFAAVTKIITSQKINAIIFEDYDKGVITPSLIQKVVELANKSGIPTTVDPKKNNFLSYKNVTLFKPNLRELKEGLHIEIPHINKAELRKAVDVLNKKIAAKQVLITLSEKGVFISEGKKDYYLPAHIRSIADVSGAGDTVISVATLCLAMKTSAEFLAAVSNLAGGLVCEKVGVVSIDKKQLLHEAVLNLT